MASGLAALLDDVAAITKLAAASLDDVSAAAGKASVKSAGIVIDDTAVTPNYVVGFSPDRELPIIWKIALGSLRNKIVFLLPGCIALSAFLPWALTPLLMIGGAFLCFEAAEKIAEKLFHAEGHAAEEGRDPCDDPAEVEAEKVAGAIRTDFILSAEIMALALADIADKPLLEQAAVLAVVGILITVGVYGVVALIVKMDDIGLNLARRRVGFVRAIGRGLVKGMPGLLAALGVIGTAAMLWVGGGIIVHGMEVFGLAAIPHAIHHAAEVAGHTIEPAGPVVEWFVNAAGSGVVGLVVGSAIVAVLHAFKRQKTA